MTIMIGVRRKNSFSTRLLLILCLVWVANSELYPFGTGNGDSILRKENDYAERVTLDRAFPFGGKYHNVLYIGDNGVISFEDAIYVESTDAKFRNLPIYYDADEDGVIEDAEAIFPFWADVDISGDGGNLYYRISTSTSTLDQATADIRNYFRSNVNFQAQVVIVVTWDQVSFYNQAGDQDPRNTFQAVLIHDGQESFVFLNYGAINWVVGSLMQGDDNTGLYSSSKIGIAIVGFSMSDGEIYEVFDYDQDTLQALPTDSNVEVDGVYAYKVDGNSIIDPVCKTGPGADLSVTPARCGMMGGERIYLYGPCWAVERVQTCVFSHGGETIQEVNATVLNTNEAYCVPDPFFLIGEVTIAVVKAGDELSTSPTTIYSLLESGRVAPTITRRDPGSFNWDMADNSLTITWEPDQESFGSSDSALSINVLAYREDNPGPRWETVYLITNSTADDGSHTFTPTAQQEVTEDNAFGVIRITGNANGRERVLWSDIHPLGYLLEQSYQDDPVLWATDKCNEWLTADDAKGLFIENLPACPCTLEQATEDVGTFITDPACNTLNPDANCVGNEGAIYCVLSAYASRITMSGTKCCYDENNLLMHSGDTRYAGMTGRSHIRGASPYRQRNLVPELSHWSNDVIAKHFCCRWASEKECFEYTKIRPTTDCVAYEPPTISLSFGDPHYITMDRTNFTFNGLGEFTLLRYAMSETKTGPFDFELQGRQIKTLDKNGREVDVTKLSSIAMQDSGSDTIVVEASASSGMDVYRRGTEDNAEWQSVYFSHQTFTDLQGCVVGVTEFKLDVQIHGVVVMFKETGISVAVNYHDGMLAVQPVLPSTIDSDHLSGLFGNRDGDPSNDLEARNSNTPLEDSTDEDIFRFGQSWEIEADYTLFRYVSNRDHSHYHNPSFVPRMNVALPTLYPPCNNIYQCLFDYEVSNDDEDLALATLDAYEKFKSSSENIRKIDACPYLITPYNGTKSYSSDSNRYFEGAEVTFTCDESLLMVGSSFKRCEYDMEAGSLVWTGSEGDNECIESTCGVLPTPANGSIALSEDGRTAYFACQDGFTLSGAMQSVCQDGIWSNTAPTCIGSTIPLLTIGIVVLAILLLASIIINIVQLILPVRKNIPEFDKSKKNDKGDEVNTQQEGNDNVAYEMIQSGDRAYTALKLGATHSFVIAHENLTFFTRLGPIGRGDFGVVWKGDLRSNQKHLDVAIRQIPDRVTKSLHVLQAIKVLYKLSDQPNIVRCLGYCKEQGSILNEFISGGTLLTHLQTSGVQSQPTYSNLKPKGVRIEEGALLNLAWQVAKGMQFLASKKIIHGALCAHNVLLGERKQCKISDYGLSSSFFGDIAKPTRWSSPETMVTGDQTTEGDIWSFGIVLWEIVTLGARPYPNITFGAVQTEVANGYQMPRPRHCAQEVYSVMTGCWEKDPTKRTNFDRILKDLERILEKTHSYLSLNDLDEQLYAYTSDM